MITEIKGNLLDTDCKVIAHGVNCQNAMGSGVAKALYSKWPEVKFDYHKVCTKMLQHCTNDDLLGHIFAVNSDDKLIINCFTQQNYGYDGQVYLNYEALEMCMRGVREFCKGYSVSEVAMPKIGCGLAGGDWEKVKKILDKTFHKKHFHVKVYYLDEKP